MLRGSGADVQGRLSDVPSSAAHGVARWSAGVVLVTRAVQRRLESLKFVTAIAKQA